MTAIVTTTVGSSRDADALAAALVNERLAACVHVTGPVRSWYRWEGHVEQAEEWRCEAKTTLEGAPRVVARISELHSYEVPEILITETAGGSGPYLTWVSENVGDG